MFERTRLSVILGALALGLASCAEAPPADAPVAEAPKEAPEPEGPYFDLTKDGLTGHEGWTSRNVMLKGAKIGDKTTAVEKSFGKLDKGDAYGDHIRTIYEGSSYAVYTFKMTGELQKFEIYDTFAGEIADPKLKKLLNSGSEDDLHELLGPEDEKLAAHRLHRRRRIHLRRLGFPFCQVRCGLKKDQLADLREDREVKSRARLATGLRRSAPCR
jgi:hypothetical protein